MRYLTYPFGMINLFLVALFFSMFELSVFYTRPSIGDVVGILFVLSPFFVFLPFSRYFKTSLVDFDIREKSQYYLIFLVVSFFILEFVSYGVPLINGAREDFTGFPFFHVLFYALLMHLNLRAILYPNLKIAYVSLLLSIFVFALMLSRQGLVFSVAAIVYNFSTKRLLKIKYILMGLVLFVFAFALIGNLRQMNSGDYFEGYILEIGGANEYGRILGANIYWSWLYVASPIYNLFHNLNGVMYQSIFSLEFSQFLELFALPDNVVKMLGVKETIPIWVVDWLNVGTGYAKMAMYGGYFAAFFQSCFLVLCYLFWLLITKGRSRSLVIAAFTCISFLMIFSNPFTRAEFFVIPLFCFFEGIFVVFKLSPLARKRLV